MGQSRDRVLKSAPLLAAAALHVAMHGRWPSSHPLLVAAGTAAILAALTLRERPPRLWRVCIRLLVLIALAPSLVRTPILADPAIPAALLAWPLAVLASCIARDLRTTRGNVLHRLRVSIAGLSPDATRLARSELALLRFGLLRWRPLPLPSGGVAFPNVATGTELALLWLTAAGSVVEIPLLHVLIRHFSPASAWTVSSLELLGMLYMTGYAKSVIWCPSVLFEDRLLIRLGTLASRLVPLSAIDDARLLRPGERRAPGIVRLFGIDDPNLAIRSGGQEFRFRVDRPQHLLASLAPSIRTAA